MPSSHILPYDVMLARYDVMLARCGDKPGDNFNKLYFMLHLYRERFMKRTRYEQSGVFVACCTRL